MNVRASPRVIPMSDATEGSGFTGIESEPDPDGDAMERALYLADAVDTSDVPEDVDADGLLEFIENADALFATETAKSDVEYIIRNWSDAPSRERWAVSYIVNDIQTAIGDFFGGSDE